MLDIKFIRENSEQVQSAITAKKLDSIVSTDAILDADAKLRALQIRLEDHRALRNSLSGTIAKVGPEERTKLIAEATHVKEEIAKLESDYENLKAELTGLLSQVPNVIAPDVPQGKDDSENVVVRKWGDPPKFDFTAKDHVDLGTSLDLIDIETSAEVSGSRFNYLKNEAVLLQFALISYVFYVLTNKDIIEQLAKKVGNPSTKPFVPVVPPVFIKSEVSKKMDRFDPIEERYYFEKDDMLLVGSAEHTLGPMYMNKVVDAKDLPIRMIGYSTAFRREAGSYGKDTRGILRRHQFDKLEMETFSTPETGLLEQELLVAVQEYLVQSLEIPHQIVMICTGDMGKPDYRQIDLECYMPGQGVYRETHTSDYMTDFQARRLNAKYRTLDGSLSFMHMNDATALAIGRILIAILENNQQKDGSIVVPRVLVPYMHGIQVIKKK